MAEKTDIFNKLKNVFHSLSPEQPEKEYSLPLYLISGRTKQYKLPMVCAYAGNSTTNMAMWVSIIFNTAENQNLGPYPVKSIKRYLKKNHPHCSMLFIEQGGTDGQNRDIGNAIIFPNSIQTYLDISKSIESFPKDSRRYFSNTRRLISKYNLSYEMTDSEEAQKLFYYNMYLPYIGGKHGNICRIIIFEDVFSPLVPFTIIQIKQEGQVIAAGVVHFKRGQAVYAFMGVKDGRFDSVSKGGLTATYFFLIKEMQKRGFAEFHIGGSPPILTHNLTRHKIRMSAQLDKDCKYKENEFICCCLLNESEATREFLTTGPFVFRNKAGKMNGVMWIKKGQFSSEEEFKKKAGLLQKFGIYKNYILELERNALPASWNKLFSKETFIRARANKYCSY